MNVIEPIADAVTGGTLAHAVEPDTGLDRSGHTTERNCLNCGTALVGSFCHQCGQKGHVHRTLRAFAHDLLHGVLHFEGKIFRTLPKLMFKPGELTRRYIAGERARFVSPLALFLFSVFTMFAVMSLTAGPSEWLESMRNPEVQVEFRRELGEADGRLERLRKERAALAARGAPTDTQDLAIKEAERQRRLVADLLAGEETASSREAYRAGLESGRAAVPKVDAAPRQARMPSGDEPSLMWFDKAYQQAKANPGLLIYKLQTNAYKFSWALILLSVPFMALLFLWRWRPLYDHAVFVTYSITAVSILVILGAVLVLAGLSPNAITIAALLFIPWHMYRQLRGGYGLKRVSALWRTAALVVFANLALSLFAFGLLMLGVLG
jgi:hypothetical protein